MLMRYHVVGAHGGAWIYDVDSHEEFERLLAVAPGLQLRPLHRPPARRHDGRQHGSPDDVELVGDPSRTTSSARTATC